MTRDQPAGTVDLLLAVERVEQGRADVLDRMREGRRAGSPSSPGSRAGGTFR